MINFHKDHATLVNVALMGFVLLSTGVAISPALYMQDNNAPLPGMPKMTEQEQRGLNVYVSEGCIGCHTQQVRNIEMDKTWGSRPSMPSDYYYSKQRPDIWHNTPSLLGSERTGPDLTNVGVRKGSEAWQMLHLYDPRMVEKASIMPRYGWLFKQVDSTAVKPDDFVLTVPADKLDHPGSKVIATERAKDLVAYLISLKQTPLPEGVVAEAFIATPGADGKPVAPAAAGAAAPAVDGSKVFTSVCAACHQPDAKGIPGAFPALAGADLVNEKDPLKMVDIVLGGYEGLPQYGPMPSQAHLSDEEIAAVINYVRSNFGNDAPPTDAATVKTQRAVLAPETVQQ
ncbi:MAG: cbb3-type cytochrome c oxidase subunit II [Flavobacteriales bacterium]|jgi:cytochrome c oxidase cbb3-type subunit 2|nr:cbb3-type cytochrome c oxidase subunit II [Flavobacteriales bacterium]